MMMANKTGTRPVKKTTRQESEGSSAMNDTSLRNRLLTNDARNRPAEGAKQKQQEESRELLCLNIECKQSKDMHAKGDRPTGADV
jgi:hypothetical protein